MNPNTFSIGSLLSVSFREIVNRFRYLFLLALISPIGSWILQIVAPEVNQDNPLEQLGLIMLFSLLSFVFALISFWIMITLVLFICKRADNFRDLFILALKRIPRVFGGLFVYGVAIGAYILFCVITTILILSIFGANNIFAAIVAILLPILMGIGLLFVGVRLALLPYALILSNVPFWQTFSVAYKLTTNNFWKTLLFLFTLGAISLGILLAGAIVSGTITFILTMFLGSPLRAVCLFFMIIPVTLSFLMQQVSLVALYIDRLHAMQQNNVVPTNE